MADDVLQTQLHWPDKDNGPWLVTLEWEAINGRLDLASFKIARPDLAEPVSATLLRSIPLGRLTEEGRQVHAQWFEREVELLNSVKPLSQDELAQIAEMRPAWVNTSRRRGRRGYPPDHFQEVAETYAMAWAAGKRPTKAVAEKWAVNSATAAKWVSKARKLGFLDPTAKGRAGGVRIKLEGHVFQNVPQFFGGTVEPTSNVDDGGEE